MDAIDAVQGSCGRRGNEADFVPKQDPLIVNMPILLRNNTLDSPTRTHQAGGSGKKEAYLAAHRRIASRRPRGYSLSMSTVIGETFAKVWERTIQPNQADLPPDAARYFLKLH